MAAFLAVTLPGVAVAAPPGGEPSGVFSPDWWADTFGISVSQDALTFGWRLAIGILLFVAGWLIAKSIAYLVYRLLRSTDIDNRLAARLGMDSVMGVDPSRPGSKDRVERGIARVVYWVLMLLVIVGLLDYANLDQTAGPLEGVVETFAAALPMIAKAALILVVAYFGAVILRALVVRALEFLRLDARFAELDARERALDTSGSGELDVDPSVTTPRPFSQAAGAVVFWLIMGLGLVGAFEALEIEAISVPLSNLFDRFIELLPAIGAAVLIGLGGWVLSKIVRIVVTRGLQALGFDRLLARARLDGVFGAWSPSRLVGWVAMALVLIQTAIAALDRLGIETLTGPLTDMMKQFWDRLPAIAVSILILILGVFVGRLLRRVVQTALAAVGFDRLLGRMGYNMLADRNDDLARPSGLVAYIVQIAVVLLALVQALRNVGLDTWAGYVDTFLVYMVTHVAIALLIVIVGFAVGNYVRDLIVARQRPTTMPGAQQTVWLAEFARYAVLVFAFTMAVHQLGLSEEFVLLSFGLLFGGLCLAAALAFGLGSRDLAGEIVREQYQQAQQTGPGGVGGTGGYGPGTGTARTQSIKPPAPPSSRE